MKINLYPASERGTASFGWLQANFSFSFGQYYNPDRVQFGMLRVLNDDTISAGAGFGQHSHDNMEIITIPLEGSLKHEDSMGNKGLISFGEVQVMSAGTGIQHSEMNGSNLEQAKTLQIWILPQILDVEPRYDQKSFDLEANKNAFVTLVAPYDKQTSGALWVYQQTYFNLGIFEEDKTAQYQTKLAGNGLYIFLIEGSIKIDGTILIRRDAVGITDADNITISALQKSTILLIEVPMQYV